MIDHFSTKKTYFLLGIIFLFFNACTTSKQVTDPLQVVKDEQVKTILRKAFTAMGGIQNWQALQTLQFQKNTELYLASGEIEQNTFQNHTYHYRPNQKVQIDWEKDNKVYQTTMENGQVQKKVNGQIDATANPISLKNGVLAATFVVGLPFKLLDEGVALSYEGKKELPNGKTVEVIKAVYNPTAHQNHSKSDTWWHYFDSIDFHQVGYTVKLIDHNSYVENLSFEKVDGFLFTRTRKSWRVNENGEKTYLRAAYEYSNYKTSK